MEFIVLLISLFGIVFGADFLVSGAVSIARKLKVSDFVIGAAIVGVGTSMPELVVSFIGALKGNADVAIGNVVGSNIFNVLGILGITALFFPVAVERANIKFEIPLCIAISVLLVLLVFNFFNGEEAVIGRVDGLLLLALFGTYLYFSFRNDKKGESSSEPSLGSEAITPAVPVGKSIIKVLGGLALLIISCDLFVNNAVIIAQSFGVNDAFISLTLIACGTSLPELAASVAAALKKNTAMALGNIVGSNIFNITLILGLSSQVMPLNSAGIGIVDYSVMIFAVLLVALLGIRGRIGRFAGLFMFVCFILYNWYLISNQSII